MTLGRMFSIVQQLAVVRTFTALLVSYFLLGAISYVVPQFSLDWSKLAIGIVFIPLFTLGIDLARTQLLIALAVAVAASAIGCVATYWITTLSIWMGWRAAKDSLTVVSCPYLFGPFLLLVILCLRALQIRSNRRALERGTARFNPEEVSHRKSVIDAFRRKRGR